jgi:hypothetical protein
LICAVKVDTKFEAMYESITIVLNRIFPWVLLLLNWITLDWRRYKVPSSVLCALNATHSITLLPAILTGTSMRLAIVTQLRLADRMAARLIAYMLAAPGMHPLSTLQPTSALLTFPLPIARMTVAVSTHKV